MRWCRLTGELPHQRLELEAVIGGRVGTITRDSFDHAVARAASDYRIYQLQLVLMNKDADLTSEVLARMYAEG
jgi:hypothetical protein